ncbi:type I glyceraldehyde-3-phosphate dehydrogenase [Dehalococcoides mccartyi]|jgi:glyceraldehyde 3-phosphate dehydrogenase|uniref:Type I glyceraldehyde-3-phosphate dehydrogenase n=1 Tax=Dehalococcoides mccartyi TaxID=61435 RepID=A0A2J1DX15_9CHLR|nr:type I glyceraldehyde-3-phosphate dehydrogenase [Dehalococcoides mccartyi]AQX74403.1 type I glyceraldehyde-3-phosphate dehydrogenase [Dehalococcoides mccartyi]AQY72980.1 type I glyceraldehyde-3-phosphate dehydrogenase [Dehalococcoides mccartyi]PKH46686.1 type I glyceraldehyde-3-phosphate dehydrogenase [Dehalococcoides mccartyi]BAS31634.1 glyceraldehyde-3-phosphate dehydrogenase [Dehalococcoides mccartyi IBARAKI]
MVTRIGINGFGRIGRITLRTINQYHRGELEVVAVNDLADNKSNAHLLKWDSTYGKYAGTVESDDCSIIVDGKPIRVFSERDPMQIPWETAGVDLVIESTGLFTDASKAAAHLRGSVKTVVISAPAKGEDITIVMGVNEDKYNCNTHRIISNASCTTNCVAPLIKVLHDKFGVKKGFMTTCHAYTNDQKIQDMFHKDIRRARAAAVNVIPTTTGAAKAVALVLPELKGKLDGISFRIPSASVSLVDFVGELARDVTVEEVNAAFKEASQGKLSGILEYCEEELVSSDFKGNPASSIIDAPSTMVLGGNMVKVLSWYDNEWGYSTRLGDLIAYIAKK